MKNIFHIVLPTIILFAVSCSKDISPQSDPVQDEAVRISIEPMFELDVDVKSVAIGTSDILCYAYNGANLVSGFPKKQTEIQGNTYFYDIPKSTTCHIFFVAYDAAATLNYKYDVYNLNGYSLNGWQHVMVNELSEVICERKEYYISNADNWYSKALSFYLDEDYNMGQITLSNMQRDCKLMFNFVGLPEGETPETYIGNIHIKVGGLALDKILTMEDLEAETVDEETLWCKTIYTVMGLDRFGTGFKTMDIIIECSDGKIYVANQFVYNYKRNEQQRININFSTQE